MGLFDIAKSVIYSWYPVGVCVFILILLIAWDITAFSKTSAILTGVFAVLLGLLLAAKWYTKGFVTATETLGVM